MKDPYGEPDSEEIAHYREACRTDLKFLCKEILGMDWWDDNLHDNLQEFIVKSGKKKGILIPRGHLKTSIVVGWIIQQLLIDPNETILIRNAVWDFSRIMLKQIQGYLTSEPLLTIFGVFCQPQCIWTKDEIQIAQRRNNVSREPSITTAGLETALTGRHFSIIVDDDLVNDLNSTTKEQIQKVVTTFNDSQNLLNSGGKHIVIGTRYANRELYGTLLANNTRSVNGMAIDKKDGVDAWRKVYQRWIVQQLRANKFHWLAESSLGGEFDFYIRRAEENGKVIFGKQFCLTDIERELLAKQGIDKKSLETLKRNPRQYACQMNNDPLDDDLIEFKRDWFLHIERTEALMKKLQHIEPIISIDPAFRMKQTNDSTGIAVTKALPDNSVYILEAKQFKANASTLIDEIFRLVEVYGAKRILLETVSAQVLLVDLLRNEMKKRNKWFSIEETKTNTTETKAMRIRGLVPFYANGRIYHIGPLPDLESQLLEFPRGMHDDIIDALAYQIPYWKYIPQTKAKLAEKEGTWNWWASKAHRPKSGIQKLFDDLKGM